MYVIDSMYQEVFTIVAWQLGIAGVAIIVFSLAHFLLAKAKD
jgi:hypothetical protein